MQDNTQFGKPNSIWAIATLFFCVLTLLPNTADAALFPSFLSKNSEAEEIDSGTLANSQKMNLATSNLGPGSIGKDTTSSTTDVQITKDAISPSMGPVGSAIEVASLPTTDQITLYTVHAGDTISKVATMFGVSKATIIENNDLPANGALVPGSVIVILPTSGLQVTIKSGDTLKNLGKKYKVDPSYIAFYNDMALEDTLLIGDTLIIPDAEIEQTPVKTTITSKPSIPKIYNSSLPNLDAFFTPPLDAGYETSDLHGFGRYGVDLASPRGTPIHSSLSGTVIVAKYSGYNTGYGKFVVVSSIVNGYSVQVLYAHMSEVSVNVGDTVSQGQVIGKVGSTGRSTGSHVHFEVRGAQNPYRHQLHRTIYR